MPLDRQPRADCPVPALAHGAARAARGGTSAPGDPLRAEAGSRASPGSFRGARGLARECGADHASKLGASSLWQRIGYRSKQAEWVLLFLLGTGLALWDRVGVAWPTFRNALFLHVAVSLVLFPLCVAPFWLSHRRLLRSSRKHPLRLTGRLLELALVVLRVSDQREHPDRAIVNTRIGIVNTKIGHGEHLDRAW